MCTWSDCSPTDTTMKFLAERQTLESNQRTSIENALHEIFIWLHDVKNLKNEDRLLRYLEQKMVALSSTLQNNGVDYDLVIPVLCSIMEAAASHCYEGSRDTFYGRRLMNLALQTSAVRSY